MQTVATDCLVKINISKLSCIRYSLITIKLLQATLCVVWNFDDDLSRIRDSQFPWTTFWLWVKGISFANQNYHLEINEMSKGNSRKGNRETKKTKKEKPKVLATSNTMTKSALLELGSKKGKWNEEYPHIFNRLTISFSRRASGTI